MSIYHDGEIEVQRRAGVEDMARRVGRMVQPEIPAIAAQFLKDQSMVILAAIDDDQRVWASLLTGQPGFMQALDNQTVRIEAQPSITDPLNKILQAEADLGMIAIEFASRRRVRLNGKGQITSNGIYIKAQQVFSNCPKYIQARVPVADTTLNTNTDANSSQGRLSDRLSSEQWQLISMADTFFIASYHAGGADASHRGGKPGFIQVINERKLLIPDYSGNNMFLTLGNIVANANVGLLFLDFQKGSTLQITGKALINWDQSLAAKFSGAERIIEFNVDQVVENPAVMPFNWKLVSYSPFNP